MVKTGETPGEAAESLGLVSEAKQTTEPESEQAGWSVAEDSTSASPTPRRKSTVGRKREKSINPETTVSRLQSFFPELEARAVKSLFDLAARHSCGPEVMKVAGLLISSGWSVAEAMETAELSARDSEVRKVLTILDTCMDLNALITQGRCHPECAPMLAALGKKMSSLKQAVLQASRKSPATRKRQRKFVIPKSKT